MALRPHSTKARFQLAFTDDTARRWKQATTEYRAVLRLAPDEPQTLLNLARLEAAHGQAEQAKEQYRHVITLPPPGGGPAMQARARIGLGSILKAEGDAAGATTLFDEAASIDPSLASQIPR